MDKSPMNFLLRPIFSQNICLKAQIFILLVVTYSPMLTLISKAYSSCKRIMTLDLPSTSFGHISFPQHWTTRNLTIKIKSALWNNSNENFTSSSRYRLSRYTSSFRLKIFVLVRMLFCSTNNVKGLAIRSSEP